MPPLPKPRQDPKKMKLTEATELLKNSGIEDPKREARMLFAALGGYPTVRLVCEDVDTDNETLIAAIKRRAERYPMQYIIGKTDFYRESYLVSEDCLIPRSDTEILVDYAVKHLPPRSRFADLCTGSGCVALSTLNNTENTSALLLDLSPKALEMAKKNAARLGLCDRAEFVLGDALETAPDGELFAILSNPPYVTEAAYAELAPEIYSEPKMALVAEDGGLLFYKRLIPLYKNRIADDGFMAFEIGYDQGEALRILAKENSMTAEILCDLSGLDRVAVLRKK